MIIIGLSGLAGSGKDTVADMLVKDFDFVKISLSDPLKRICKDVYDFSDEQLWGPSEKRSEPDLRYPRPCKKCAENRKWGFDGVMECCGEGRGTLYLSAREALQTLGTEWGRDLCFDLTWVDYLLRTVEKLKEPFTTYSQKLGIYSSPPRLHIPETWVEVEGVVVPDLRFKNEMFPLKEKGGKLVRIRRPGAGLSGSAGMHVSEREQLSIPDSEFEFILENDDTLEHLGDQVRLMVEALNG